MPLVKITQQILLTLQPINSKATFYWDTDLRGFGVKVTASAVRSYVAYSRA
jgi:hypothetical protein